MDPISIPKGTGGRLAKSLIITEKPSVARDIAGALGGFEEKDGYWESGYCPPGYWDEYCDSY